MQYRITILRVISFVMTGSPTITLPAGFTKAGLPIGIQLIAQHRDELSLLRAAMTFQGVTAGIEVIRSTDCQAVPAPISANHSSNLFQIGSHEAAIRFLIRRLAQAPYNSHSRSCSLPTCAAFPWRPRISPVASWARSLRYRFLVSIPGFDRAIALLAHTPDLLQRFASLPRVPAESQ